MSATPATDELSEYERARAARIACNQERLRSSGLAHVVIAMSRPQQSTKAPPRRKEKGVAQAVRNQPHRNVKQNVKPVAEDDEEAAPAEGDESESDSEDVKDTGNEDDVGVLEPYEAWCAALRALEWENPENVPALGSALSETGYMPFCPVLRELGDTGIMDEFFSNLSCSVQSVKPLKDWLRLRAFLKKMMMSTPKDQICPESLNASVEPTVTHQVCYIFTSKCYSCYAMWF